MALALLSVEGRLGEATMLVEDRWQHRGVGTAILRRLLTRAERAGCVAVIAHTGADNVAVLRTVRPARPPRHHRAGRRAAHGDHSGDPVEDSGADLTVGGR